MTTLPPRPGPPEIPWTQEDEDAANRAMDHYVASGLDDDAGADPQENDPEAWAAEDVAVDEVIAEAIRQYGDDGEGGPGQ